MDELRAESAAQLVEAEAANRAGLMAITEETEEQARRLVSQGVSDWQVHAHSQQLFRGN